MVKSYFLLTLACQDQEQWISMFIRLFCFSLAFISTGSEAYFLDRCLQLQGVNRHFSTSEYNYVERELSFKPCAMV